MILALALGALLPPALAVLRGVGVVAAIAGHRDPGQLLVERSLLLQSLALGVDAAKALLDLSNEPLV
eukprot:7789100-Alexandrium_andersonii.AAC.1